MTLNSKKLKHWTACGTALVSFAAGSLVTARLAQTREVRADSNRVFELRVYHSLPGKLPAMESRFRDTTSKLLAKHKADIAKSVAQLHIPYPVLLDGDSIAKPYGDSDVYPTSFFVDRSGTVVAASFGLTSKDDLEGNIRKALGEGK